MSRPIGIDLGTTHSCVAVMEGAFPRIVPNRQGERLTPSVVALAPDGTWLVGQGAKRQALTRPKGAVFAVMRLIGRRFASEEVGEAQDFLACDLVEARNGDVHLKIDDKVCSPTEVCSVLLEELKTAAEDDLGQPVEEAVIACPAYYNECQRQALKDAGLIAGLDIGHIINSSTAATLALALDSRANEGFVAAYDLGGGTFDISILETADGLFQVRATGGDTSLGGEDFDRRIIDWLVSEFLRDTGIDLRQDPMARLRLKDAAESAKRQLSSAQQTEIDLPFVVAGAGPRHLHAVLTRQKYEALTDDLVERTIEACRRCLADANLRADQIEEVLLFGGQTGAPMVSDAVRRLFGKEPNRTVRADEGAALGAALQAGISAGDVKDLVLLDVAPHTLGVEAEDGKFAPVIERNSTIPTRSSRIFTTSADNQARIEVHLLQGESDRATDNKSLAKLELTEVPPAPKGVPQIEVTFAINVRGVVSVSALDQATGLTRHIPFDTCGGLSPSDLGRLADASRIRQTAQKATKDHETVVRQLDGLLANSSRSARLLESKLTRLEQERIVTAIARGEKARKDGSLEELRASLQDMEEAATLIGRAILRP